MNSDEPNAELDRRQFFVRIGTRSVTVAGLGACALAYQFLSPTVLYEPSPIVNMGKPATYPADSVTFDPAAAIYVVHDTPGLFALRATCTHLACVTTWKPDLGVVACPCHGSQFRRDGSKITGPATGPLPWLQLWLNDEGDLLVDRSSPLAERKFLKV